MLQCRGMKSKKTQINISNKDIWRMISPSIKPYIWGYAGVVVLTSFISILTVADPVIYGRMIDIIVNALGSENTSSLVTDTGVLLGFWVGIFFVNTIFGIIGHYLFWYLNNKVSVLYTRDIIHRMLRWSQQRFNDNSTGETLRIFNDAWDGLFSILGEFFENVFPTIITFTVVLATGFFIDWRLTLISMIMFPVSVAMGIYSWKKARPRQRELGKAWAELSQIVSENISNISTIQNFAQENPREKTFLRETVKVVKKQLRMNVFWAFVYGMGDTMSMIARITVFSIGVFFVADGSLTLGVLVTFLGMLNYLLSPIQYMIANSLPRISRVVASFHLMAELYYKENDVVELDDADSLVLQDGEIEFRDVSFVYSDQKRPTVRDISLVIPGGSSCALVGPSGAGKSTLIKLINRVMDATSGSVSIDGNDVSGLKLQSLRSKIGVVSQETLLFHDTILNNVRFSRPSATFNEVVAACKKAEAHKFILDTSKGYKSIVGERGVKLSGGERQRIALARIFLADPPILILDESTSALDSETEHKLQKTLQKVMRGRTTVLIAHRLSTVYLADKIIVVDGGRIVDEGTHDELTRKGGLYSRLWKLQSGGYIK